MNSSSNLLLSSTWCFIFISGITTFWTIKTSKFRLKQNQTSSCSGPDEATTLQPAVSIHLAVRLSRCGSVLCCMPCQAVIGGINPLVAGYTQPAHWKRGVCRQHLLVMVIYATCVALLISTTAARSYHVKILSLRQKKWLIKLFSCKKNPIIAPMTKMRECLLWKGSSWNTDQR